MPTKLGPSVPKYLRVNYEAVEDRSLTPIERLSALESVSVNLRDFQGTLALTARAEGFTWQEIADVLHITRQAAQQRFGMSVM
jgi:DNA-directed RNA polymerase specialized sigma24 family protein